MTAAVAPTQSTLQAAIKAFLTAFLPSDVKVIAGVVNRVPEPAASRFVTIIPIRWERLRTNVDSFSDCRFTGSIAGTTLTASFGSGDFGEIEVGALVFGTGLAVGTKIVAYLTGAGEDGTYQISPTQTVAPVLMAAGQTLLEQGAQVTVQFDFHSANNTAGDLAQIVSTLLRDEAGVAAFADTGVSPLYADDPKYTPFINENQQAEFRWVLEARFQVNQVVVIPAQYADSVDVTLVDVDATYPPT